MSERVVPRVLACVEAIGIRIVKRSEPCPWCGCPWEAHEESYVLEDKFRKDDLPPRPVSEGE